MSTQTPSAMTARLALADGTVFHGRPFGAVNEPVLTTAEVVFNTAMTGYQESLTDPSYAGQILVQTAPLIGNTGTNDEDFESRKIQVAGFAVHECANRSSNFRSDRSLEAELERAGILGISAIDTRALVRIIRAAGAAPGALTNRTDLSDQELVKAARLAPSMEGANLVSTVAGQESDRWTETKAPWASTTQSGKGLTVLALDCGVKRNILRNLASRGCSVEIISHKTPADEILDRFRTGQASGLFVSNGPGDPAAVEDTIATLRTILQAHPEVTVPIFGICLGHQLLAIAAGAKTYKLKFGHRGTNQPIRDESHNRVQITSQNHGFAVDAESLRACGGQVTHTHLNDGTVAGFRLTSQPVFAVQYHPEASPGPHDADALFDAFVAAMTDNASQINNLDSTLA